MLSLQTPFPGKTFCSRILTKRSCRPRPRPPAPGPLSWYTICLLGTLGVTGMRHNVAFCVRRLPSPGNIFAKFTHIVAGTPLCSASWANGTVHFSSSSFPGERGVSPGGSYADRDETRNWKKGPGRRGPAGRPTAASPRRPHVPNTERSEDTRLKKAREENQTTCDEKSQHGPHPVCQTPDSRGAGRPSGWTLPTWL